MLRYLPSQPWRDIPLAIFDLESTGLDVETERIVEIAVLRVSPRGEKQTLELLLNPGKAIPPAATQVNGIGDEDVADAPSLQDKIWDIDRILRDCILVGHNALGYDIPLLQAEFRRCGVELTDRPAIDTMLWARQLKVSGKLRLGAVATALDVPLERAHRAMPDVVATHGILEKMADNMPETLGEMLGIQRKASAAWERKMGGKQTAPTPEDEGERPQGGLFAQE